MSIGSKCHHGLSAITLLLILCLGSAPATASSLNFLPSSSTVLPGESISIDVVFTDPGGTLVGAFDFYVNYDPGILSFDTNDVTFGPGLGGMATSLQSTTEMTAGNANIAQLSMITDLSANQNGTDDLLLFSMAFNADQLGESMLSFSGGIDPTIDFLGDENGSPIVLDEIGTASINVVPIPNPALLMLLGLAGIYGIKHRRGR